MRGIVARFLVIAGAISLVWICSSQAPAARRQEPEALPGPRAAGEVSPLYMGVASCSAVACHHANGPMSSPRSEYSTWAGHDKHARAYQVLFDDRSERIVRNLTDSGEILRKGEKPLPAREQPLCLKCHATYTGETMRTSDRFQISDGVGCESCHGSAENWLTTHYQAGFKDLPQSEKAKFGLVDTKSLHVRAKICARCHIGDETREVNHDLIAAGHPRLSFELGGYLSLYKRHWPESSDRARYPDFEARAWLVGQVAGAEAAVELLEHRAQCAAGKGKISKPWPEFSEFGCYACHKDLNVIPWGKNKAEESIKEGYVKRSEIRRPGTLPYGTWYLANIRMLADNHDAFKDQKEALNTLIQSMEQPSVSPAQVAQNASRVRSNLAKLAEKLQQEKVLLKGDRARALARLLAGDGEKKNVALDWDGAAQIYLGLAALQFDADPSMDLKADIRDLGRGLKSVFPKNYDSPRLFNPVAEPRVDLKLEDRFKNILKHLGQ